MEGDRKKGQSPTGRHGLDPDVPRTPGREPGGMEGEGSPRAEEGLGTEVEGVRRHGSREPQNGGLDPGCLNGESLVFRNGRSWLTSS